MKLGQKPRPYKPRSIQPKLYNGSAHSCGSTLRYVSSKTCYHCTRAKRNNHRERPAPIDDGVSAAMRAWR